MSLPPTVKASRSPKIILRTVIVLVVLGGMGWGVKVMWRQMSPGLFGNKREEKIPTARVKPATISEEIVAVGRLRAVFSTELRSEINGRIIKISAADGDHVVRDQEIIRLDQTDIITQLQEMEKNIEAAKLKTSRAKTDFDRISSLEKSGVVTPKDIEDARTTLMLSENDTAIFEARAANLRDKLTKTVLRAPHDGTLLLRDLTEGQVVTSVAAQNGGTLLGEVADLSGLMVRTNVNEIDVARLKLGDQARVRVDSIRSIQMDGSIKRISTSALESSYDRTRVFPVDVMIDGADPRLRPGMSATVTFTLSYVEDTMAVPLSAVFSTAEAIRYVFLKKGERFEVRIVETGIADVRRVQILTGLEGGDEVALTRPLDFDGEVPVAPSVAPKRKRNSNSNSSPSDPLAPQMPADARPVRASGKPDRT